MKYFTLFCFCLVVFIHDSSAFDLERLRQEVLKQHNIFRSEQCAAPLQRNTKLDEIAQKWCKQIAKTGQLVHSNTTDYGENSFQQIPFDTNKENGATPVNVWYSEKSKYNVAKPEKTLHFTQIVWKNTTMLGVGVCGIPNNGIVVVANYYPRGNYENQFAQNVGCSN